MRINENWASEFFSAVSDAGVLRRRESSSIEFKRIFEWASKEFKSNISRSAAAFANRDGGLIIFGVADKPHEIIGAENFFKTDDAEIATYFNELFSPSIDFERHSFIVDKKTIGVIRIFEAKHKPVICIKDSAKTCDSDIYYRYSARSSKIKSGDLLNLLSDIKEKEQANWLSFLSNISQVGMDNVALLNSVTGVLTSSKNTFLLDSTLLDQIKVLDKYSECSNGAPAVRIIGEVVDSAKVVEKARNIFEEDVFESFLSGKLMTTGMEYISVIATMNSEFYPIYFFLNANNTPEPDRANHVMKIQSRFKNKTKIIERITNDKKIESKHSQYSMTSLGAGEERRKFFDALSCGEKIEIHNDTDCKLALECIFSINRHEADISHIKSQLLMIFRTYYPFKKDGVNHIFRWALTYIDNVFYKNSSN